MGEQAAAEGGPLPMVLGLLRADAPVTVIGAPQDWPRWAVLLPHVLAATSYLRGVPGRGEAAGPEVAARLGNLALILRDLGQLQEARLLAERALAITEAAYGPDHPTVVILRSNLEGILRDLEYPD